MVPRPNAATAPHRVARRLINQNQFHAVLTEFSGVIDVDNVWHRVAQNNKGANNPFKHRPSLRTIK